MPDSHRYREPFLSALTRAVGIALVAATVISLGRMKQWPVIFAALLWPAFGGHWVELWYLNWLRPRVGGGAGRQVAARIAAWFLGGIVLGAAAWATAAALLGQQWTRKP